MDWDKLKIFHAVAEAGSVTSATVNLNLSQSAISRQIQSLEDDLKVKLFERHARGLTLTENGEYADYRSNAMGSTNNIYAYGFKSNSDVEIDNNGVANNYNSGDLSFEGKVNLIDNDPNFSVFSSMSANVDSDSFNISSETISIHVCSPSILNSVWIPS